MSDISVLRQLAERAAVVELARAGAAEATGSSENFERHVLEAADVLAQMFLVDAIGVPYVIEALKSHGPLVRPGDLLAATELASDAIARIADERPAVLHPDCSKWIDTAIVEFDSADRDRVAAAATLVMSVDGISMPGDLPLTDELRDLAGECTAADLRAGIRVRELHAKELADSSTRLAELLQTLEHPMLNRGLTLEEAVNELSGEDRVHAEELLASLPTILCVVR
ncbi:hypothetical protein [Dermatobacter hominis]|uniref:hypothetical protein n=1 Tax=Dermatobacter hominis TaxID=2884263 RepID=UPI001D1185D9|nr:hypothetical protein [Dermatobacter hominis]UDY35688.1 hypothetical protein LH044_20475 [Dermatobacter hominis]